MSGFLNRLFYVRPLSEYPSTQLERLPYYKLSFKVDTTKASERIAPQSRKILQTFVWRGAQT